MRTLLRVRFRWYQSYMLLGIVLTCVGCGAAAERPPTQPRLGREVHEVSSESHAEPTVEVRPGNIASVVIAEFTTPLIHWQTNRNRNIRVAATRLDGATVAPGEVLSVNEVIGHRTQDKGYFWAGVIEDGEFTTGMGGGVCQVASTLHAAAFFGGLDIVEYHSHSRVVRYLEPGLDAAVTWLKDLKISNPFSFPVRVEASVQPAEERGDASLTVRLVGEDDPRCVEIARWPTSVPSLGIHVDLPDWARSERGIFRGKTVFRQRSITENGRTWVEHTTVRYPFNQRVIRLPPGIRGIDDERVGAHCPDPSG